MSTIEYQVGMGEMGPLWAPTGEREAEFVSLAAAYEKIPESEVRARIARGEKVIYDWYGSLGPHHLREREVVEAQMAAADAVRAQRDAANPILRCRSCGQTGRRGGYPFSTHPASGLCDDCL